LSTLKRNANVVIGYDDTEFGVEPIVLIHGFPLNRTMWNEQVAALRDRHRVITLDLRGHGESTLDEPVSSMEMMAEDVAALLDKLQVERPTIAALSMGGYVALAFHELYPQRMAGLVLADTRAYADTPAAQVTREETAKRVLEDGMEVLVDSMMPKLLSASALATRSEVVERVHEMIRANSPEGAAAALRGMAVRKDRTKLLSSISVPTLIVVGSDDTITPPKDAFEMAAEIPSSRVQVIDGAGHLSNLEQPAEFNQALTGFLDKRLSVASDG
jgi:3-oxoadipate enol-lactonase